MLVVCLKKRKHEKAAKKEGQYRVNSGHSHQSKSVLSKLSSIEMAPHHHTSAESSVDRESSPNSSARSRIMRALFHAPIQTKLSGSLVSPFSRQTQKQMTPMVVTNYYCFFGCILNECCVSLALKFTLMRGNKYTHYVAWSNLIPQHNLGTCINLLSFYKNGSNFEHFRKHRFL